MSADNGVYILETPSPDGPEFRVEHLMAIDNLNWDEKSFCQTDDEDVRIINARWMYKDAPKFVEKDRALQHAAKILEELPVCEYGIGFIKINRCFY